MFGTSPVARAIIRLLREDPNGWKVGSYVAHHAGSAVGIWIANDTYGLKVWAGAEADYSAASRPNGWDRRAIRRAVDNLGILRVTEALAEIVKPLRDAT